ncbi:MAG: undecaprenyl-diphosphate phosphatase [Chitinophagales bacterium]|nr:undecaprenyl-diphosphate phosphatase [Chitinophagales bacterium]MDW8419400.1 undecaprenyl-diphosphate phosphatase [Chitinophagales bacterium]
MTTAEAVIIAIVEGLTEFLPISSTGHMILTEAAMGMRGTDFLKAYTVSIQFGAIASVVVLYWRRFVQSLDFYLKLFVAFVPVAVVGLLLNDYIEQLLESVPVVAVALVLGGIILVFLDKYYHKQIEAAEDDPDYVTVRKVDEFGIEYTDQELRKFKISWSQAFFIGCFQCLGLIPGVSRAAATIVGGLQQGLNIKRSAEFSFFLAVPTIFAASAFSLWEHRGSVTGSNVDFLIIGTLVSFIVGMIAIKFFIALITRLGLKFFGYYRIILGLVFLILLYLGYDIKINH